MSEPTASEGGPAALTRHAAFVPEAVHRSRINFAAYNPRLITEAARKKLRANVERVGLLEPIVWNRRTGNVVGGHQRLKCLDALEGSPDYLVPVAAVDLDEATEKAQNVFLNNAEAQGEWDLVKLAELLPDVPTPELTGFDRGDLFALFGRDVTVEPLPDVLTRPPDQFEGDGDDGSEDEGGSEQVVARPPQPPAERDQQWDRRAGEQAEREPGDFYHVLVHKSDAARDEFARRFGLKPGRYVDPDTLVAAVRGERPGSS